MPSDMCVYDYDDIFKFPDDTKCDRVHMSDHAVITRNCIGKLLLKHLLYTTPHFLHDSRGEYPQSINASLYLDLWLWVYLGLFSNLITSMTVTSSWLAKTF